MTTWHLLTAYQCRHCREPCINHRDSAPTRHRECRDCFDLPSLDPPPSTP